MVGCSGAAKSAMVTETLSYSRIKAIVRVPRGASGAGEIVEAKVRRLGDIRGIIEG